MKRFLEGIIVIAFWSAVIFYFVWGFNQSVAFRKNCVIKGNISFYTGEKIYHVPGGDYYEATRINGEGERYFCTVEAAEAAGFRRSP